MAVVSDGRAMGHADVVHALREAGRVEDSLGDSDSIFMDRIRDGQVKFGAARHNNYAGSQRRMVDQMKTGTVIHHALLNVLKRESEHLWVCPVCKYDNLSTRAFFLAERAGTAFQNLFKKD
jgi:hypothetical protein